MAKKFLLLLFMITSISSCNRGMKLVEYKDPRPIHHEQTQETLKITSDIIRNYQDRKDHISELEKMIAENKESFEYLEDSIDLYIKTVLRIRLNVSYALLIDDDYKALLILNDTEELLLKNIFEESRNTALNELNIINVARREILETMP